MLPGSSRPLSAASTTPTQVSFSRDGDALVVTEKITRLIDTWLVGHDGMATNPSNVHVGGDMAFRFRRRSRRSDFRFRGRRRHGKRKLRLLLPTLRLGRSDRHQRKVPTEQTAACWLVLTYDGRYVYTANAGSASISGFSVQREMGA